MIRLMQQSDIPAAMRLKETAGWNQTEHDWANVLALEPEGCWVCEKHGQVAGTTTAICYGQELAWIGMVLVLPEFRGRGLGRRLMEHCLRWLESCNVRQVKLDATDMGLPLYEKLGFRTERPIERWGAAADSHARISSAALPVEPIAQLDRDSFGVDRTALLRKLVEVFPGQGVWREGEGFVLGRPGSNAYYIGPCSATGPEQAGRLIRALMQQTDAQAFFWDLLPGLPGVVDIAQELGFERKRTLSRMALGPLGFRERAFAAAGFEYG